MLLAFGLLAVAYLLGSIPSGLWIGKIFYHKNLHELGSGNTGATNTFRNLGTKAGIFVFIIDVSKGSLAVLLPFFFHDPYLSPLIYGLLAVIGHTFSVFDGFKGGKAVATSAGVILAYSPFFVLYMLIVFIIVLLLFSMISLSSISAALAALVGLAVFPALHFILPHYDWPFSLVIAALSAIIISRHRENIMRIRQKCESTIPFGLNLSKQVPKNKQTKKSQN